EVLILDEATAHIDPESEAIIEEGLAALMAGRTSLVIAHRLSIIRRADHIIVLSRGAIVEQGSRAELLARGGVYASLEQTFHRAEQERAHGAPARSPLRAGAGSGHRSRARRRPLRTAPWQARSRRWPWGSSRRPSNGCAPSSTAPGSR